MKKVILPLSMGLLVFASCKKDYTCECKNTRTETNQGTSEITSSSSIVTYKNVSKKTVENEFDCFSHGYKYSSGSIGDITTVEYQYECAIKK